MAPIPNPGDIGGQAVALRISGDQAAFWGCGFFGAQDTLHDDKGRHYFRDCYIQGSIDFIYGNGKSFYQVYNLKYFEPRLYGVDSKIFFKNFFFDIYIYIYVCVIFIMFIILKLLVPFILHVKKKINFLKINILYQETCNSINIFSYFQ